MNDWERPKLVIQIDNKRRELSRSWWKPVDWFTKCGEYVLPSPVPFLWTMITDQSQIAALDAKEEQEADQCQ